MKDRFSVEKKNKERRWLGQNVQRSLQLEEMFSVQITLVCLTGAVIQAPYVLGYLSGHEQELL